MKYVVLVNAPAERERSAFRDGLKADLIEAGVVSLAGVDAVTLLLAERPTAADLAADPPYDAVIEVIGSAGCGDHLAERLSNHMECRVLLVTETRWKDNCPMEAGQQTPGVGMVALWTPRPGVPRKDVARHFAEHGPLALEIHHGSRRYVQNWIEEPDGLDPPFAGMATHHFRSFEDVQGGMFRTEEDVAVIQADVSDFLEDVIVFYVTEHVLKLQ